MRARITESGLAAVEGRNSRKERMRAWKTRHDSQARQLEKELKELDHRIEVDFVDPEAVRVPVAERAPGLLPARWHIIVRTGPGLDDHYFPIVGPNGAYRDPELSIVEEMKARDLWKQGVFEDLVKKGEREAERLRQQEITESEARVEQTAAAYRAAKRVAGDGGATKRFDRKRKGDEGLKRSKGGVLLPAGAEA